MLTPFRAGVACLVAISLSAAAVAFANLRTSTATQPAPSARTEEPLAQAIGRPGIQAAIPRASIVEKLRAALGADFGGAWFEADIHQLHVAVTSAKGLRVAGAVATRARLAENAIITQVESPWERLLAVQEQWNRRTADLLYRDEAKTVAVARRNSVVIELGSAVASSRLAALRREATKADVHVVVTSASHPYFRTQSLVGRCAKFAEHKAYCEPAIVGGVRIEGEFEFEGRKIKEFCTAGPSAVLEGASEPSPALETYLLTAGHCLHQGGGIGITWYAYNRAGDRKELGEAVEYLNKRRDVGVIRIFKPGYWVTEGQSPAPPTIALWSTREDTEPIAVTGDSEPAEGSEVCFSGQTSGKQCGVVKAPSVTISGFEKLVEVEKITAEKGDSGSPLYYKESPDIVLGITKGRLNYQKCSVSVLGRCVRRIEHETRTADVFERNPTSEMWVLNLSFVGWLKGGRNGVAESTH